MRRHLNTVYVTTENAWVRKDGENLVVEAEGQALGRVPLHMLEGLVCFGRAGASPAALAACAQAGICVSLLDPNGRFLARVEGARSGNVLLRRQQYRLADAPAQSLAVVQGIVAAKAANQRTVVQRALRDHGGALPEEGRELLQNAVVRLNDTARRALRSQEIDIARGIEGEAARIYFSAFPYFIRAEGFSFTVRSRRPPLDPVNALLSFLYALLGHDCRSALESVGLDPQVGFLHADKPGRPSLALDLMEEFRPLLADRLALKLINRRQLGVKDFNIEEGGAVRLTDEARKELLKAYQDRKQTQIIHPFLDEKVTLGLVPHIQARLLARHLRGDMDGYPAFIWK